MHHTTFLSDLHALSCRAFPALVFLVALSAFPSFGEERLAWSPDGRSLAVLRGSSLSVSPVDSDLPASEVAPDNASPGPVSWSSDSRRLFFARRIGARVEIVASGLSDRSAVVLAPHRGSNWSPILAGEDELLFLSDRDAFCDVYVLSLSDRSVRRLTRDENLEALLCAAPKVRRCAYLSTSPFGEDTVLLAHLDNPFPAALPGPWKHVAELALSPEGQYLAVAASDALYLCELEPRGFPLPFRTAPPSPRITSLPAGRCVTFSADGRYLASLEEGSVIVRSLHPLSEVSRPLDDQGRGQVGEGPLLRYALVFSPVRRELAYLGHAPRVSDSVVALLDASGRRRWLARSPDELEVAARVALVEGAFDEIRDLLPRLTSLPSSTPFPPGPSRIELLVALGRYDDAIQYSLSSSPPDHASAGLIALLHSRSPSRALPWLSAAPDPDSQAFAEALHKAPSALLPRLIQAERALREGRPSDALPSVRFAVAHAPDLLWTARLAVAEADLALVGAAPRGGAFIDLTEVLRASPDSALRDRVLLALGRLTATFDRGTDSAAQRLADALRATSDPILRVSRFRDAVFALAPIASLSHFQTLITAFNAPSHPSSEPAWGEALPSEALAKEAVEILDSVGRPELANDLLRLFAKSFDLRASDLLGLLRSLDLLAPSFHFREGVANLPPWARGRIEILASLPADEAVAAPTARLFSILLDRPDLPATLPAESAPSSQAPAEPGSTLEALCDLLEGDRLLDAGDVSGALRHFRSGALLCGQSDFARAGAFAQGTLVADSSRGDVSRAWLTWERNCSAGPWGALSCRLGALSLVPSASSREDCLPFARAALLRARSTDKLFDPVFGPFFEELFAYRRLSAETVFLAPPGPAILDPDPHARYLEVQALRTFLRDRHAAFFFPEVLRLLVTRLRADLHPWTAVREARELLDALRLDSPRSANEPVILLALGRIFLEDLADEPGAYEALDRLTVDFPDSPEFPDASLLAARIEKRRADEIALREGSGATGSQPSGAAPPETTQPFRASPQGEPSVGRSTAVALVRKALSRLAALGPSCPDVPAVSLRVLEADCTLLLGQLENDPVLVRLARKSYVRVFSDFPHSPEVVDGSLLARVYNSLTDEELSRVVRLQPSFLSAALNALDPWQKARAERLFPELLPAKP
ncbi:MAG: hypothetical protein V2A58_03560 [Planctomycetota bacterium]